MSYTISGISWDKDSVFQSIEMVYKGDGCIQDGSCFEKLANESDAWLNQRRLRAQQNNFLQSIVHARYFDIFTSPIHRERNASKELLELYDVLDISVDNKGTKRDNFMKQGMEITSLMTRAFLVSDNYSQDELAQYNIQDQKSKRMLPYFRWVSPKSVNKNSIETDVFGSLTRFGFYLYMKNNNGEELKVEKIYTTTGIEWVTWAWRDENGNVTDSAPDKDAEESRLKDFDSLISYDFYEKYGDLPVKVVKYTDNMAGDDVLVTPNTLSIAKMSYSIYARQSETEMTLAKNNMAITVIPYDGATSEDGTKDIDLGNDGILFCSTQGNTPYILAPDLNAVKVSYEITEKDIESIFRQEGRHYATATVNQSGASKEADNKITNTRLSFLAMEAKTADEWIDTWFARWLNKDNELKDTNAYYKLDYNTVDIEKQIKLLGALLDLGGDQITEVQREVVSELSQLAFKRNKTFLQTLKETLKSWIPARATTQSDFE